MPDRKTQTNPGPDRTALVRQDSYAGRILRPLPPEITPEQKAAEATKRYLEAGQRASARAYRGISGREQSTLAIAGENVLGMILGVALLVGILAFILW